MLEEIKIINDRHSRKDLGLDMNPVLEEPKQPDSAIKRKTKARDTFRKCIKKVMLLNSLRRGKDIILQTTSKNDPTFHQYKSIITTSRNKLARLKQPEVKNKSVTRKNKKFIAIDLHKYQYGNKVDEDIFERLPEYYHRVADKYLKTHLSPVRHENMPLTSRASKKSAFMSKSQSQLPKIRNTGQGNFYSEIPKLEMRF